MVKYKWSDINMIYDPRKGAEREIISRCILHMFNKKLNVPKVLILILLSIIIFALAMVFPALQAAKAVIFADTDALVDSIDLPNAEFHVKIIMRDNLRDTDITISNTDSVSDMIYKSTTIPGLTRESIKAIYEEPGSNGF